jgi:hypothetical protein
MSLLKLYSVLASATLAMSVTLSAQREDITIESKPAPNQIVAWLDSGDPRLIAWGAHFARETGDMAATPVMVRILKEWKPGEAHSHSTGWSRLGISYVLDAFIVQEQQMPPDAILAIAPSFRTEAMILASRLPVASARPILLDWYKERGQRDFRVERKTRDRCHIAGSRF